ncbi:caspase family protein [Rhizobium leguminosarum]|uniref:caspase family protein n=1 Tax=Rhizobium leguminosarum TaxID=384 RepID=UPI001C94C05F|nr:caspase family protein [Rhizobium leguminosarum]MBY5533629.1 caspase family protein [Rhizobium leguminosarum]
MTNRKALVVGIDYYEHLDPLRGCSADARSVHGVLARHGTAARKANFKAPQALFSEDKYSRVTKRQLREAVTELFLGSHEIALFYFAGHGFIDKGDGFLCASDTQDGSDGLGLNEIFNIARASPSTNKIIVLDSCHGGVAGNPQPGDRSAKIDHGFTILTASTELQYAHEANGTGLFTNLLVDALEGAAANVLGDITPGSVYAHIDQSLGPWAKQRPVFKTNVDAFVSLRQVESPVSHSELLEITTIFPTSDHRINLDPAYEPIRFEEQKKNPLIPPPDPEKNRIFAILQDYRAVDLVRPVGAKHMYDAAMTSQACELTRLGKHYHRLVKSDLV